MDSMCDGIYAGSLNSDDAILISRELRGNVAFASGYLLYVNDGSLCAQPFDMGRLEMSGTSVPVAQHEIEPGAFYQSGFSAAQRDILILQSSMDFVSRLVWTDPSGKELGDLSAFGYKDPSISPDGRSLAVSSAETRNGKQYICIYDLERGVARRLTDGGTEVQPAWSADGTKIAYASATRNGWSSYEISAGGANPQQLLCEAGVCPHWSPDGHAVFMRFDGPRVMLAVRSPSDEQVTSFGPGAEPQFSPDGRWIAAVQQDGAGILARPFPGPGPHIQISAPGGTQPRWSRDGKEIFYIARDKKMMAVKFDAQKGIACAPRALFTTRIIGQTLVGFQYDVAPDGRFLINSLPSSSPPLTLLTGWTTLLHQ